MKIYRAESFPQIEVKGKPNPRAKRLTLRRDARGGGFTISHPKRTSEREIQRFIDQHGEWIEKHHRPSQTVSIGSHLPFRGAEYEIVEGDKRGVRIDGETFAVNSANPSKSIASFLKTQAQLYAPSRLDHYSALINKPVTALRWRDPKTRWGSCDSNGVIMLSWRLIMAPDAVFDYVIAHEVAHRVEMNHSDRFWNIVADIYPEHKAARAWLRNEGRAIQALLF